MINNDKKIDIQKALELIIYIGIAIYILGIGLAFASIEKYFIIFRLNKIEGILSVILLICTIGWGIYYIYTVHNELGLLGRFFNVRKISRIKPNVFFIGVFMTITFALLIGFSYNLILYCVLAIIFEIFDILGGKIIHKNIKTEYIEEIGKEDSKKDERKIIADFYLNNPTFLRTNLILISFFIALIMLIQKTDKYIPYIIIILTIIVGNIIIELWRRKTNKGLDDIENKKRLE